MTIHEIVAETCKTCRISLEIVSDTLRMAYENLIACYTSLEKNFRSKTFESDFIGYDHADFLPLTKFNRVGIHHGTVHPGSRLSLPHCESLEEEFLFVIEGELDCWLDGHIYPMKAMDAIGFPAGTGLCHTFINNSSKPTRVLVIGERTKKENRWWFPLNPEKKQEHLAKWWEDAPKPTFGPHNGLPGPVRPEEIGTVHKDMIIHCLDLHRESTWSYPNSTEKFGAGHRLSNPAKLKTLGIWFDELTPGRRSSWPHAHTHEEEFCFILSGHPTAWFNGFLQPLKAGDGIAFPPNTNIAHCIMNETKESVFYIGVGESEEFSDEKIIYPLHPERNEEMRNGNWLWIDPPKVEYGPCLK